MLVPVVENVEKIFEDVFILPFEQTVKYLTNKRKR